MGQGSGSAFVFASPAAQSEWRRRAYAQAVHPDNWHRGDSIDPATAHALDAGIAGPTAPTFRGPDNQRYFGNTATIEPADWRTTRARYFADRPISDLEREYAVTGRMPGEAEALGTDTSPANRATALPSTGQASTTLSPQGRAILDGMEQARRTKPHIVTKMAQAAGSDATAPGTPTATTRDYAAEPEMIPTALLPQEDGAKIWPEIPAGWISQDPGGDLVFTPEASRELDMFKEEMREESGKYNRLIRLRDPDAPTYTGEFLQHYLEGSGDALEIPPSEALLADRSVASADNVLHDHIVSWLTTPGKTTKASEAIVPKILALEDGESVSVSSLWNGATGRKDALVAPFTTPTTWSALGNVQIRGDIVAKITRQGDRYLAVVDVTKTLIDRYDFTDDDGETSANGLVWAANLFGSDLRPIDLAKMHLLAVTGRSKPFDIRASWRTSIVAKLKRIPPMRMMPTNRLQLVDQEITSTFPPAQDPPIKTE